MSQQRISGVEQNGKVPFGTLTGEELRQQMAFNDTVVPYPMDKTLNLLFEEQVAKNPGHTALMLGDRVLTYQELNEYANQLARQLIKQGLKQGDNVGLLSTRNFDMVIGMYGILKAGGAYVPVDPDYPIDRQMYILSNSAVNQMVTDREYPISSQVPKIKCTKLNLQKLREYDGSNLNLAISSQQLAYTIYTSGSTGTPKGVMIAHHSAVNLALWVNNRFDVGPNDRLLFITSMCFDLSVYDIFGMLAAGGTVVIAAQTQINDINQLQQMLQQYRITFWDSVPSTLDYLVKELEANNRDYNQNSLRIVFLSGDWIPVSLPDRIERFFPSAQVISLGGATEATVWSNYFVIEATDSKWNSIPYGRPIANNFFYILDDELQPVPNGTMGNLWIGGAGVAVGYANAPDKTADSFITDPFNTDHGGKMYRTGDLGRMLPDMNMEFIGRKDTQVKIRGFRVELGEIEHILTASRHLESVVVLAKKDKDGQNYLICFMVPKGTYDKERVIKDLKGKLPDYMIPTQWVEMQSLPLNINGKIDRKALLDIDLLPPADAPLYVAPSTPDEITMAIFWQEVFGLEKIGVNDDFFALGGHSLMALQILSRFEKETGKKILPAELFKNPTILSLVNSIKNNAQVKPKSLVAIKPSGNKMPLYVIHGDGLYVLNFKDLAKYVDPQQPIFGLQPKDLDQLDKSIETIPDIAHHYIQEILEQNPNGPYAIAGYSFGGYIAVEMEKQLVAMGKEVKMLGMFDTDAQHTFYNKPWYIKLPKRITRQFPKFLWVAKSFIKAPSTVLDYQYHWLSKKTNKVMNNLGLIKNPEVEGVDKQIKMISERNEVALQTYEMKPFDNRVYLFRAQSRAYFVDDFKYLGWQKYAKQGVEIFSVPGNHATMFEEPNVHELGKAVQSALDNC